MIWFLLLLTLIYFAVRGQFGTLVNLASAPAGGTENVTK